MGTFFCQNSTLGDVAAGLGISHASLSSAWKHCFVPIHLFASPRGGGGVWFGNRLTARIQRLVACSRFRPFQCGMRGESKWAVCFVGQGAAAGLAAPLKSNNVLPGIWRGR